MLELSTRQIRNLLRRLNQFGLNELESRSGKIGNNKINMFFRERALSILKEEKFEGFGPTLASEYLNSEYNSLSVEMAQDSCRYVEVKNVFKKEEISNVM